MGKATQQPVYNLLGGPCRSRIRVYANGWSYKMQKPEDYARGAEAVVKRGFTAMKLDPVPLGVCRTYIPKDHIRRAVKVMRAMRDAWPGSWTSTSCSISTGGWRRCTPSTSPMRSPNSSRIGWKSRASRRTSRRWPRCAMPAGFWLSPARCFTPAPISARFSAPALPTSSIRTYRTAAAFSNS